MAAYASIQRESSARIYSSSCAEGRLVTGPSAAQQPGARANVQFSSEILGSAIVSELVDRLAERLAVVVAERLVAEDRRTDEWFDCRHAAEYLGVHRDTLRKLAAERAIPSEQDGPGCKLYFRRSDLDVWRRSGGKPRHLASIVGAAA
ncbi:MAG: helix-turn-helix domain-containing protein [Solirubrobacterales bacterium]|nr:helix-turn-helix domain-containing protein [Solirubrobacterales bacterium]